VSLESDTRDRVIRLEAEMSGMRRDFEDMSEKVTEMHALLLQAKGARWVIIGAATVGGFFAAKMAAWLPWIASLPPK
jgi:predicted esterase YcpF (UPF0227 family)